LNGRAICLYHPPMADTVPVFSADQRVFPQVTGELA
jgi:hypothetical protein